MNLTEEEQKICNYYSQTFEDGKVGCSRCPLQVNRRWCVCKANCTEEEWEEREEQFDCNDCYYSMQNCKDRSICCEDETALCDNFEPVVEREDNDTAD